MKNKENSVIAQEIREEYIEKKPGKIDELVRLDREVKRPAKAFAYVVGTVGSLVMGSGMCLAMGVIGKRKLPGVIIGCAGIAMMTGTYPMYKAHLKTRKAAYADRIIALSNEVEEETVAEATCETQE